LHESHLEEKQLANGNWPKPHCRLGAMLELAGLLNSCHSERSEESALQREWKFYVYILSSKSHRIYVGMTNSLFNRAMQHKEGKIAGFTKRYKINRLVYFEPFRYVNNCIAREKQVKAWARAKQVVLIERFNPTWEDLAQDWGKTLEPSQPKQEKQIPHYVRNDNLREPIPWAISTMELH
jgi:putative endonuclease